MGKWGWYSANDDGKVVSKTEQRSDGSVHRYDYTKEDNIKSGHGHKVYKNMSDYIDDKPSWSRSKDSVESKNKSWRGNGYIFEKLYYCSFEELQYIAATTDNEYIRNSANYYLYQNCNVSNNLILKLMK